MGNVCPQEGCSLGATRRWLPWTTMELGTARLAGRKGRSWMVRPMLPLGCAGEMAEDMAQKKGGYGRPSE